MSNDVEVLIVGGGPAGLAAAGMSAQPFYAWNARGA